MNKAKLFVAMLSWLRRSMHPAVVENADEKSDDQRGNTEHDDRSVQLPAEPVHLRPDADSAE